MQAIFLLDYGKGSALSSLIYNPRVAVDNQLGATVNCQLAMGNYNANWSPVITASYLAFSFKHSFIREKEYRIRALSGEMNKIPAPLSYPLGLPSFLYRALRSDTKYIFFTFWVSAIITLLFGRSVVRGESSRRVELLEIRRVFDLYRL